MTYLRQDKTLLGVAEGIAASLEETKANAQAGFKNVQHGIRFESDSYIIFEGESYSSSDPDNEEIEIDSDFEITTNLRSDTVVFSKIKGSPDETGTVTVSLIDDSNIFVDVTIGQLGDIAVIE